MINKFAFQARRSTVVWVQLSPLLLTSCVAVGQSLHLMGPQFPHLKNGQNSCLSECLWESKEIMQVTQLSLCLTSI